MDGLVSRPKMQGAPRFISRMTVIESFIEADEILKSPLFESGHLETESLAFRSETLIDVDGREHLERRRVQAKLFTREALRYYEAEILDQAIERCFDDLRSRLSATGT